MTLEVAVSEPDQRWRKAWPDALASIDALCQHVLNAQGASIGKEQIIEVSFLLTNDAEVRSLNKDYRGKDAATNVLSFPSGEALDGGDYVGFGPPVLLGDIALAYETVEREAADKGLAVKDHASHLVIHGVLHLLGFDHQTEEEAAAMETKEIEFCRDFGIANPYGAFL